MRRVIIEPVMNGFLVKIGCKRLVFSEITSVCSELIRYQLNPYEVENEYLRAPMNTPVDDGPTAELREEIRRPSECEPDRAVEFTRPSMGSNVIE